jgi:hypothetical protein
LNLRPSGCEPDDLPLPLPIHRKRLQQRIQLEPGRLPAVENCLELVDLERRISALEAGAKGGEGGS